MTTPTPRSRRLATLYAALLLVAVFGAGAAGGFWAGRSSSAARSPSAGRPDAPPPGGLAPPELRQLNLTLEQQIQARDIGDRYRPHLDALRRRIQPEAEKLHRKMRAELRKILTPEQRDLHDRLEPEHRLGRPDGPRPPGGPEGPHGGPGGPDRPRSHGGPEGPGRAPAEARRACESQAVNAPCSFTLPTGAAVTGVCLKPPDESTPVCVPHEHLR